MDRPGSRLFRTHLCLSFFCLVSACGGGGSGPATTAPVALPLVENSPPNVDAGSDQNAQGGGVVRLVGAANDPDGNALKYSWIQLSGPAVRLTSDTSRATSFLAPLMSGTVTLEFELSVTDDANLVAKDTTAVAVITGFTPCKPVAPPADVVAHFGLDSFYTKYCDANGIPVISSSKVPDRALEWARYLALEMLKLRPDVAQELIANDVRIAIIAETEVTTDIPEYSKLYTQFPGTDWDSRVRGLGASTFIPVSSTSEENILCYATDTYRGFSVFFHEFAHSMDESALRFLDATFESRLVNTYNQAMSAGLWAGTYAATNEKEYWAEGVTTWFDANLDNTEDVLHNYVDTRQELAAYDPGLYQLILEAFPESQLAACPPGLGSTGQP